MHYFWTPQPPPERLNKQLVVALLPFARFVPPRFIPKGFLRYPAPLRKAFSLLWSAQDSSRRAVTAYAEPRDVERLQLYVSELLDKVEPAPRVTLVLSGPEDVAPVEGEIERWHSIVRPVADTDAARLEAIQVAVAQGGGSPARLLLVYRDAIGLGNTRLERMLFAAGHRRLLVLNGRNRLFEFSHDEHRTLLWRRRLVRSRLVEYAVAVLLWPVAGALALKDAVLGPTHR